MGIGDFTQSTGLYKHYKGNIYNVIGEARHTETQEKLVLYQLIIGTGQQGIIFARPKGMFNGKVRIKQDNGNIKKMRRFRLLNPDETINLKGEM